MSQIVQSSLSVPGILGAQNHQKDAFDAPMGSSEANFKDAYKVQVSRIMPTYQGERAMDLALSHSRGRNLPKKKIESKESRNKRHKSHASNEFIVNSPRISSRGKREK